MALCHCGIAVCFHQTVNRVQHVFDGDADIGTYDSVYAFFGPVRNLFLPYKCQVPRLRPNVHTPLYMECRIFLQEHLYMA